jgi:hypothetical protein
MLISMRSILLCAWLAAALWLVACGDARQDTPADPAGEPVTAANLLASERWWPYRVGMKNAWQSPSRVEQIPAGLVGVLIRVEGSGLPRIDFGSLGKYEVPVEHTDLLERANRIRTGAEPKDDPNFVHAIEARMLDAASDPLQPLPADVAGRFSSFLLVFADPTAPELEELARALAPLRERTGQMTIFFPQGRHEDATLRDRLRALEWPVAFLYDHLSEPYTRTLLPDGRPFPYLMLQTAEGRVLLEEAWSADTVARLTEAMNPAS